MTSNQMEHDRVDTIAVEPSRIYGEVSISGAKNSVLRLMAASILTGDPIKIQNYPASLLDAIVHKGMLEALGKTCEVVGQEILIKESGPLSNTLDWNGRSIRNTLLILGALLARTGYGAVPLPGGCSIGAENGDRAYDLHVMLMREMGATVWEHNGYLCAEAKNGRTKGADIHLPIRSTGATENAILIGCLAEGTTRIWNPHVRPEILDLIKMLQSMGASIQVYGQEHIEILGSDFLSGATHTVIPDNVEALTWLVGAAVTGGEIQINQFPFEHLEVPLIHLRESGAKLYRHDDALIVKGCNCYPLELSTGPYPGINSDMQPILAVYSAKAQGQSKFIDLRFPGRYAYADELNKMQLKSHVKGNVLIIDGGHPLAGAHVKALDLRAGIALTLAGLFAEGETTIHDAWQITRGYDQFIAKMQAVGAKIETSYKAPEMFFRASECATR